jgi:hypothetical protein
VYSGLWMILATGLVIFDGKSGEVLPLPRRQHRCRISRQSPHPEPLPARRRCWTRCAPWSHRLDRARRQVDLLDAHIGN